MARVTFHEVRRRSVSGGTLTHHGSTAMDNATPSKPAL